MTNKEHYRRFCESENTIPIFSQAWWLDALCEDAWDVCLVERDGEVVASMPYVIKRKFGLKVLSQPPLTQHLGPWIKPTGAKYANALSREKEMMTALIRQLPKYNHFLQNWHFSYTNWLPFYWAGFKETTCYTYRLEKLGDEDQIWSGMQPNIRREIKKASNREGVNVRTDLGASDFFELNKKVFQRQGKQVPYSKNLFFGLDQETSERKCRKIFIAEDTEGRAHAGIYMIWDENSAYYLMGGSDPKLRNSGATSLCMWEAIRFASTVTKCFDFEGSMLEPVERFFRSFGAVQTPYHKISCTPSKMLRFGTILRSLKKQTAGI